MTDKALFGVRLAAARKRAGMTQAELAAALGERYDHSTISAVERQRAAMRFDGAVRAAQVLSVSLDYLAGLTDDPRPRPAAASGDDAGSLPPIGWPQLLRRLEEVAKLAEVLERQSDRRWGGVGVKLVREAMASLVEVLRDMSEFDDKPKRPK